MAKHKKDKKEASNARNDAVSRSSTAELSAAEPKPRMKQKEYRRELRSLHGELVALQEWVKATGAKIWPIRTLDGRQGAGGSRVGDRPEQVRCASKDPARLVI